MNGWRPDTTESALRFLVAHEMRAPLSAIRSLADLVDARWDDLSEEQKRHALRTTVQEASRLLALIDSVSAADDMTTESRA